MVMTKKNAAQLLKDALSSEKKLATKVIIVVINAFIISGLITYLTSWYFGLASLMICGLLGQFAHERMSNSIQARKLLAIKSLRWDEAELNDPKLITKLDKFLQ